jgi:hypothetical protein
MHEERTSHVHLASVPKIEKWGKPEIQKEGEISTIFFGAANITFEIDFPSYTHIHKCVKFPKSESFG